LETTLDAAPPDVDPAPVAAPRSTTERRSLIVILVVAGLLRVGFGLWSMDLVPATWQGSGDQYSYWYYGNEIADGDGYVSYIDGSATSYYPVGYPVTLAALFFVQEHTPIPDDQPEAVALLHAAMSTAAVWFVFLIGRAALGSRRGLIAAAIAALFPNLIMLVGTYSVETAFIFWSMGALAILATHDWDGGPPSTKRLLAFGVVLGASVVTRPFAAPFIGFLAVAMLVRHMGWKRTARAVGIAVIPVVIAVMPLTIRNYRAFDAFVPISNNLGDTACLDRSMNADGGFRWAVEGCADPGMHEVERNRANLRHAISFIVHHPLKELELMGKRFGRMMEGDHSALLESESVNGRLVSGTARNALIHLADLYFWIVFVLAGVGLVGLFRRGARRVPRAFVASALILFLWIPIELWGNTRFHIPALPLAAIAAAAVPLTFGRGLGTEA
jgi:4-amino-4-deoxy-L-arabinose transferase-like glycosyltransferase